jgi:hypothetical protein
MFHADFVELDGWANISMETKLFRMGSKFIIYER